MIEGVTIFLLGMALGVFIGLVAAGNYYNKKCLEHLREQASEINDKWYKKLGEKRWLE